MFSPRGRMLKPVVQRPVPLTHRIFSGWLRALRAPGFIWLWTGQTVSAIGDRIFQVALALTLIKTLGPVALAFSLGAQSLVETMFLLVGGVIADRMRRITIMIGADVLRLVAVTILAVVSIKPVLSPVIALSAVMGLGAAIFGPGYGATIPDLVPVDAIRPANALVVLASRLALIVGPPIGGGLTILLGSRIAFLADAVTFLISILTLMRVRRETTQKIEPQGSILSDAVDGMREIARHQWYMATIFVSMAQMALGLAPYAILLPVVAVAHLGGSGTYPILLAAFGVGSVVGSLVAGSWAPPKLGIVALLILWLIGIYLILLGISHNLPLVFTFAILGGVAQELFNTYLGSAIQEEVPQAYQARVYSLEFFGSMVAYPIGLALVGLFATTNPSLILVGAGVVFLITSPLPLLAPGGTEFRTPGLPRQGSPLAGGSQ